MVRSSTPALIVDSSCLSSQGHLLELKLAAVQSLNYEDFFALFGQGRHPDFRGLLDSAIAPNLSSIAYQFWRVNDDAFSSAFYLRGYSGWALRLARFIFSLAGVSEDVEALCNCDTLQQQQKIWEEKLRPVLLNPVVVALLRSPIFCWNALGVPLNQRRMLLEEGSMYDFICHTLDPLASKYLFKTGAYFYLLVSHPRQSSALPILINAPGASWALYTELLSCLPYSCWV
jgi:betaine lipid synthase